MRSNRVRWSEVDRDTYEDMVAVLISRLHPTAQRIDGSGGDGGRDVQVPLETGLEIYQLKSHTGRMAKKQRDQVKDSLNSAKEHQPTAWYLVVPIDHTPGELDWFEGLTSACPFPCKWLGKTWVDSHMADMPEIYRYYLEGASEEVIELIERLNIEGTALNDGIPGAIGRFQALQTELNQIDPHYMFHLSSRAGEAVAISIHPRYRGADKDRPIHLRPVFSFPDTPEARRVQEELQRSFDYGTSCTVPSEFIERVQLDLPAGLDGDYVGGTLTLGSNTTGDAGDETMELRILDPDETVLSQLSLKRTTITRGLLGPRRIFVDSSRAITVVLQADLDQLSVDCTIQYSHPDEYSPSTLLPAVRLIASLSPEISVQVMINGEHVCDSVVDPTSMFIKEARGFANLLEALAFFQLTTGRNFFIRGELTLEEVRALDFAVRLLRGEIVTSTWTERTISVTREDYEKAVAPNSVHALCDVIPTSIRIQDQVVPIGSVISEVKSASLRDPPSGRPDDTDTPMVLTFVPEADNTMSHRLQPAE